MEETEEALPPIFIVINKKIARQVKVASIGHSSESQAENKDCILLNVRGQGVASDYLPVYIRNIIFIQGNHFNALVCERVTIEFLYICSCNFEEAEIVMYLSGGHRQYSLP